MSSAKRDIDSKGPSGGADFRDPKKSSRCFCGTWGNKNKGNEDLW